jgi:adenosylhomocysteine nucleosidase
MNCDEKLVSLAKKIHIDTNVHLGVVASGDIFISDENMGAKINKKFDVLCVEMEGAAIAQVCQLCNIPFLVVRAISDSPYEKDNHITFDEFLKISSNMAAKFIIKFVEMI